MTLKRMDGVANAHDVKLGCLFVASELAGYLLIFVVTIRWRG